MVFLRKVLIFLQLSPCPKISLISIRFDFFSLLYFYDKVLPKRFGIHRSSHPSPMAPHLEQFVSSPFYCNYPRYIIFQMYVVSEFSVDKYFFHVKNVFFDRMPSWPGRILVIVSFLHLSYERFTNIFESFTRFTITVVFKINFALAVAHHPSISTRLV